MTSGERVLVIRCPAWPPPGESPDRGREPDEQTPEPDTRAFEQVIDAVRKFCPRIEVLRPGICAISGRDPARYFGGEAELGRKIADAVADLGFDCGIGVADGLFAALLAARDGLSRADSPGREPSLAKSSQPPQSPHSTQSSQSPRPVTSVLTVSNGGSAAYLAPRMVTVLGEPDLADLLIRLGIRTLGEFAALPASEVANRFGPSGTFGHRLARGLEPRPLVTRPPSADLSARIEFDPPAERAEQVVFAAKALAGRMHGQLASHGLTCVRVRIEVTGADGEQISRLWRHDGMLSDLAMAERVRWQFDGWRSGGEGSAGVRGERADQPDDYVGQSGGVTALVLIPDQLARAQGRQLGLWGDAVVSDRVARAATRVQAMLGHDAVRQPVLAGGRGPAEQGTSVPFGEPRPAGGPGFRPAGVPGFRPAGGPTGRSGDHPAGHPVDRRANRLAAHPGERQTVRSAEQPWPGRIPEPAPSTVYPTPRPARVTGETGVLVTVTGRGLVSADPARLSIEGGPPLAVTAWTGPWPVTERWWDPERACRKARFQLVTTDGSAWLAVVQDGRWLIEAGYD